MVFIDDVLKRLTTSTALQDRIEDLAYFGSSSESIDTILYSSTTFVSSQSQKLWFLLSATHDNWRILSRCPTRSISLEKSSTLDSLDTKCMVLLRYFCLKE